MLQILSKVCWHGEHNNYIFFIILWAVMCCSQIYMWCVNPADCQIVFCYRHCHWLNLILCDVSASKFSESQTKLLLKSHFKLLHCKTVFSCSSTEFMGSCSISFYKCSNWKYLIAQFFNLSINFEFYHKAFCYIFLSKNHFPSISFDCIHFFSFQY